MNPWLFDLLTVLWVATAGVVAWTRDKVKLTDDDLEIGETKRTMWKDYEFESGHNLLVGTKTGDYCLLDRRWTLVTSEELGAGFHDEASEEFKSAVWADYWHAQGDYEPTEVPE